ncbi:MAG TPA: tripartite tricarboxylate transporter substrate-binding protein [Xanthobacteraceae bacterium]|nr:tripartite tricarboxylate transporter substrate-binding protein [Xanthobacteraceae bacterium]
MKRLASTLLIVCGLLLAVPWFAAAGYAQEYYRGKTVSIFAGRPPGGGVDSEMRLLAHHLAGHIPGRPNIIPKNMPGAGGVALGNHLFGVAAPDGLTLGVPGRTAFLLAPATGNPNARYDLQKLTYIGSAASSNFILWLRKGANISTLAQLRASKTILVFGGSSGGNSDTVVPELLLKYQNLPIKVVRGYPGTAEQALALERGEIDGMFTERASFRADPVASGLAVPILQTFPMEPGLPLLDEIARNPMEKALYRLFEVPLRVGLALVAPSELPGDITRTLRAAYLDTVSSRDYVAEATKRGFDAGRPNRGEDIADYIAKSLTNIPADVIAEFRTFGQ